MPTIILGKISEDLLIPKDKLKYLIKSAPYRYKVYNIPKKSGRGLRTIAQPAREIKQIQYWVIKNIFPHLPIHEAASAYVPARNIYDNAKVHSDKPYLLKLDFQNFFPSIKGFDLIKYLNTKPNLKLPEDDLNKLSRILCWFPKEKGSLQLSIGAPSSPFLSNAIMFDFDSKLFDYCLKNNITYSRYADDLTFSMHDKKMRGVIFTKVEKLLFSQKFPTLKINDQKTVYGSKAHRRIVTGLILANDGTVSLGRDKKRRIRAQIHHMIQGKLPEKEMHRLQGLLAFARSVEPNFIIRMEKKYGKRALKKNIV